MGASEQKFAKPGDTIEITYDRTPWFGKQVAAVPPPEKINTLPRPGDAWIIDTSGVPGFIRFEHYKVVKRAAQEAESVDVFLREQLDDNLGGVFG